MTTPTTNPTSQNNTLIPPGTEQIVLKPVSSVESIIEAYREYNRLKDNLLIEGDYQVIKWKKCIKKSGFRKLATAFGISTEIVRENRINFEKYFIYEITVRAISPNGRFTESCSSCASNEKDFNHIENDVRATAQTRGTNRAIADLIGSWEVSAEELDQVPPLWNKTEVVIPKDTTYQPYHETPEGKKHYSNMENRNKNPQYKIEEAKSSSTDNEDPELMTIKQKNYLIKLIEIRYQDEPTRATLFNRLKSLTKSEAKDAIGKMLAY